MGALFYGTSSQNVTSRHGGTGTWSKHMAKDGNFSVMGNEKNA
jgi:hypothetical protein